MACDEGKNQVSETFTAAKESLVTLSKTFWIKIVPGRLQWAIVIHHCNWWHSVVTNEETT